MLSPTLSRAEIRTRSTFLGLMWALSHPGRRQPLPDAVTDPNVALHVIGETLLDLETTFYTPDLSLAYALRQTTARDDAPESAAYHFYPHVDALSLSTIELAPAGDMLYPDRAATL
ncbi:MAG: phosphonate C-P lyase system protein PhnH, partial [Caldilineaceae bacterium]|nr:phosphonate C-P lyase system protein PhnH [Caldilineaceae bacterium]